MDLPKNEKTFIFKEVGEATHNEYPGQFTVICVPNIQERRAIEIEKSRLSADLVNPTDALAGIAIILANLRVRIIDGPEWWKQSLGGNTIKDENVLVALYNQVMDQEDLWRAEVRKKAAPPEQEGDDLGNVPTEGQNNDSPSMKQSTTSQQKTQE